MATTSATPRPSRRPPMQDDPIQLARSSRQDPPRANHGTETGYTSCPTPRHRQAGVKFRGVTATVDNPADGHDDGYQVYRVFLRKKQPIKTLSRRADERFEVDAVTTDRLKSFLAVLSLGGVGESLEPCG